MLLPEGTTVLYGCLGAPFACQLPYRSPKEPPFRMVASGEVDDVGGTKQVDPRSNHRFVWLLPGRYEKAQDIPDV